MVNGGPAFVPPADPRRPPGPEGVAPAPAGPGKVRAPFHGLLQGLHGLRELLGSLQELRVEPVEGLQLRLLDAEGVEEAGVTIACRANAVGEGLEATDETVQLLHPGEIPVGQATLGPEQPVGGLPKPPAEGLPEEAVGVPPQLLLLVSRVAREGAQPSLQGRPVRFHPFQDLIHRRLPTLMPFAPCPPPSRRSGGAG